MRQVNESLGFSIWTKNYPKSYIDEFAKFAHTHQLPIIAIVDDVLPSVVFNRTDSETRAMNNTYLQYMADAGFKNAYLVSDILPDREEDLSHVYQMGGRIAVSSFLGLLPETKRLQLEKLSLNEAIDSCWQMYVLESGMAVCGITKYLTGKRSTAFFRLAKSVIPNFEFQVID